MANQPTPAQQAAAIVHAQYVPIDYALAQQRASDAKAQAALQAAGHALIAQLQGGINPAGQAYDAAVNQQQALAQGGAHLLAGLNPNAQIQSNLQQIGAPVEQQQMLQRQTQAQFPGQGGVLNIEQGTIPGASLVAQKAAAQQFLAGLPALAGLSQQRSAQGLAAQAAQNRQALYGQRLQAAAQIPQLALNIGNTRAQQQAATASFNAEQAYRQAELDARAASQNSLDRYRQNSLASRTGSASNPKVVTSGGVLYRVNKDGTVVPLTTPQGKKVTSGGATPKIIGSASSGYYTYNPTTKKLSPLLGAKSTAGSAGLSPSAARIARAKGNQLLSHIREARTPGATYTAGPNVGKPVVPPTYNDAVRQAEQQGIPLDIIVPMLNKVYPVQYEVTNRGLKQIGIRGQPSTFASGSQRKRK